MPWLGRVIHQLAVHQRARYADHATRQTHLERLDIRTSQVTPDPICIASKGMLWGSIQAHGMLRKIVIVSDDAGQFAVGRPALCSVHAERLLHKLDTFTNLHRAALQHGRTLIWRLYDYLTDYHADPTGAVANCAPASTTSSVGAPVPSRSIACSCGCTLTSQRR